MAETKIQWADFTFNPWVGCQRVSPGCENCYAEAYDKRVGGMPKSQRPDPSTPVLRWGPKAPRVRTSEENWRQPLKWDKAAVQANVAADIAGRPRPERPRVFCASLADVFEDRPELVQWRADLFGLIDGTPHLDWLLLTKRPENINRLFPGRFYRKDVRPNVWFGTTVEDQQRANERIEALAAVRAKVRFLSMEPLIERVDIERAVYRATPRCSMCDGTASVPVDGGGKACPRCFDHQGFEPSPIHWIIVGGESGSGARPFRVAWVKDLIEQARYLRAAVFVKQLGANVRTRNDDHLLADFDDDGWFLDPKQVEHVRSNGEYYQGGEVRVHLNDPHGGDMAEWPEDLRVREFPR